MIVLVLLGTILTLCLVHLLGSYNENYWKKRGVTFHKRNRIMGPMWDFVTQDRAMFEVLYDLYKKYRNEPAVGIGSFVTPTLYVIDIENIQHVLQSDFQSFSHRGTEPLKTDPLTNNITMMNGPSWRLMRQQMTPLFTATKLKHMYYIMDKCAQDFVEFLRNDPEKLRSNTFDTMNTFSSAAIGATVFGITTKSIFDSPFLDMARKSMEPTISRNLKMAVMNLSTTLAQALNMKIWKEHEDFFVGAIKQVLRQREKENVKRHDFADICLTLQKNGVMRDPETGLEMKPTDELLAAQAFFFFIAGVEPSATSLFFTFLELGRNPDILEKVHREIDNTFVKYKGQITYDAVSEMEYLDKVLSEAVRKYPPIGFLTRQCVRDTVLPVGNIKVAKGTKVFTPIFEIHRDPKHYPNPDVFDPERFTKDAKNGDITYMPFGKGGRICIGLRYARLQVKAGILHILRNFTIKPITNKDEVKFSKQQISVRPQNMDIEFLPRIIKSN